VLANDPGQLEHGGAVLAEHRLQLAIGFDGALVCRVLQTVGLDVVPDFLDHLGAGVGTLANHGGQ
jgi:hypothetical protein